MLTSCGDQILIFCSINGNNGARAANSQSGTHGVRGDGGDILRLSVVFFILLG